MTGRSEDSPLPSTRLERGEWIIDFSGEFLERCEAAASHQKYVFFLVTYALFSWASELRLEPGNTRDGEEESRIFLIDDDPPWRDTLDVLGEPEGGRSSVVPIAGESWIDGRLIRQLPPLTPRDFADAVHASLRGLAGLDSPRRRMARALRHHAGRLDGGPTGPQTGRFHLEFEQFRVPVTLTIESPPEAGRFVLRFGAADYGPFA